MSFHSPLLMNKLFRNLTALVPGTEVNGTVQHRTPMAEATEANLKNGFPDLNIPGAAQYIDALDLAVNKALWGEADPKAALDGAAEDWKGITERLTIFCRDSA